MENCRLNGWHRNRLIFDVSRRQAMYGCSVYDIHYNNSSSYITGVCLWEIMMRGIKPWQGVRNQEVIIRLDAGERMPMPIDSPPNLYALLNHMWSYDATERPTISHVRDVLHRLLMDENERIAAGSCMSNANVERRRAVTVQPDERYCRPPPPKVLPAYRIETQKSIFYL